MMHVNLRFTIPAALLLVCSMASAQGLPKKSSKAKAKTAVQKAVVAPVLAPDAVPENTEPSTQIFQKGNSFQFNTDDDSKSKRQSGGFNFSVPGSAAEEANRETADPVNMIINDNPYKVVVGYPRWDLSLAYAPINVSFTQKLSSPTFEPTSSLTSLSAFSLLGRLNPSLDTFFELEYSQYTVGVSDATGVIYSVRESKSTIDSEMIRGFYCFIGTSSNRRSCFGGEIGQDANPSLEFVTPTVLQMAKIRNFVVGPSAIFQFPVSTKITFTTKVGYLFGLSAGQNSNLSVKSDAKIIAEAGLGGDLTDRFAMSLMFNYFNRTSKVEGKKGSITESWTTTSSGLGARLAGTFNF